MEEKQFFIGLKPFRHAALRTLSDEERKKFNKKMQRLVVHFKRCHRLEAPSVYLPNEGVRQTMLKLLKKITAVRDIIGSENPHQIPPFFELYIGFDATDEERKILADFPKMLNLLIQIIKRSVENKTYKLRPSHTQLKYLSALSIAQLLGELGIGVTVSDKGVWAKSTQYLFKNAYGHEETSANLKNILKRVKFIF